VARYTRHQLKEDRFAVSVQEQVSWAVEHRNTLFVIGGVLAAVVAIVIAGFFYLQNRDQQASVAIGQALRVSQAPLRPAGAPEQPGIQTFTSAKERAQAARTAFEKIIQDYPHTRSADFARYWVGVTLRDTGDYAGAEKELKEITGSHRDELASVAKFALASVYRDENKTKDAIDTYNDLVAHPSSTIPKSTAQLELAMMFEQAQPSEAAKLYEQIRKDDPQSIAAQVATERLGPAAKTPPPAAPPPTQK
jgi:predicted negative regulator of RcsB-dependent stress response